MPDPAMAADVSLGTNQFRLSHVQWSLRCLYKGKASVQMLMCSSFNRLPFPGLAGPQGGCSNKTGQSGAIEQYQQDAILGDSLLPHDSENLPCLSLGALGRPVNPWKCSYGL